MMRRTLIRDVEREDSLAKRVWDLTWGLVLVVALTVVSECGLRLGYAKPSPAAPPAASEPATHMVK
jgi:hypothetical protein